MTEPAVWIALGSLIINFVAILLISQRQAVKNAEDRKEEMVKLELGLRSSVDVLGARFGETVLALREKIVQTELWNRDNFVDKSTFNFAINEIKDTARRVEEKLDRRFDAADRKLEKLLNGDR